MTAVGAARRAARMVFFFQAEDGIRDKLVTGVQTCALPICSEGKASWPGRKQVWRRHGDDGRMREDVLALADDPQAGTALLVPVMRAGRQIGRASCRERVESSVVAA